MLVNPIIDRNIIFFSTFEKLFPVAKTGRPRKIDVLVLIQCIEMKLKTGANWVDIGKIAGISWQTLYRWGRLFAKFTFFKLVKKEINRIYFKSRRYTYKTMIIDGTVCENRSGSQAIGYIPKRKGKRGSKISLSTLSNGYPVAFAIGGGNVHDTRLVTKTLNAIKGFKDDLFSGITSRLLDLGYRGWKTKRNFHRFDIQPTVSSGNKNRGRIETINFLVKSFADLARRKAKKLFMYEMAVDAACCYISSKLLSKLR